MSDAWSDDPAMVVLWWASRRRGEVSLQEFVWRQRSCWKSQLKDEIFIVERWNESAMASVSRTGTEVDY